MSPIDWGFLKIGYLFPHSHLSVSLSAQQDSELVPAEDPGSGLIHKPQICIHWQISWITRLGPLGISLKYTIVFQEP